MEIQVVEDKKDKLIFKIKGEDHTFCNLLKQELWNDSAVSMAGYELGHTLTDFPIFTLGSTNPKKSLLSAVARLKKQILSLKEEFKKVK